MGGKRLLRVLVVLLAGAAVAVGLSAGPAAATTYGWNSTGTAADIVGAHAWGTFKVLTSDDAITFTANIKDTAADSHGARVRVRQVAYQAGCGWCTVLDDTHQVSASGDNATNSATWSYAYVANSRFEVKECLTEAGTDYDCGAWAPAVVAWDATDTVADVVGARGWGSVERGSDGSIRVVAHIKDTKADSHGARINIRGVCEGGCAALKSVSASGEDQTADGSFEFSAGPVTVQECLTEGGVDYICGEPYKVYDFA